MSVNLKKPVTDPFLNVNTGYNAPSPAGPVAQANQGFGWNPQTVGLVGSLAGGALSAYQGAKASNDAKAMTAQQLAQNQKQFEAEQAQQKAALGLQATQMDPFAQQRSRQKQALVGQLLSSYTPANFDESAKRFTGGLNFGPDAFKSIQDYFGPNAMAASEQAFQNTASAASPSYQIPDYLKVGYQPGEGGLSTQTPISARAGMPGAASSNPLADLSNQFAADAAGGQGDVGGGGNAAAGLIGAATPIGLSLLASKLGGQNAVSAASKFAGGASMGSKIAEAGLGGTANSIAGPAALGASLVANYLPQGSPASAARYAGLGAQVGSVIPGVGTAIGAGVGAAYGAIKGHQNATVGVREKFAQQLGTTLPNLYTQLAAAGPAGQALADEGLHKIGKQDQAANQRWIQHVAQLITA